MRSTTNQFPNVAVPGDTGTSARDPQIAAPNGACHELSDEQLDAVSGGGVWSRLVSAAKWVGSHFGYSGTDMAGNSATIISVKGGWSGNP